MGLLNLFESSLGHPFKQMPILFCKLSPLTYICVEEITSFVLEGIISFFNKKIRRLFFLYVIVLFEKSFC